MVLLRWTPNVYWLHLIEIAIFNVFALELAYCYRCVFPPLTTSGAENLVCCLLEQKVSACQCKQHHTFMCAITGSSSAFSAANYCTTVHLEKREGSMCVCVSTGSQIYTHTPKLIQMAADQTICWSCLQSMGRLHDWKINGGGKKQCSCSLLLLLLLLLACRHTDGFRLTICWIP